MFSPLLLARPLLALAALFVPAGVHAHGGRQVAGATTPSRWQTLITRPAVRQPTGIAIDLRGNPAQSKWAYTADAYTQRIVKFGTGGKMIGSWQYGDVTNRGTAAGVAVGGTGNVFVADPAMDRVSKFSPYGRLLARWTGFDEPQGVAVDRAGNIFIAEYGAHRITRLSPSGSISMRWTTDAIFAPGGTSNPTGVAIAPYDNVYVSTRCTVTVSCGVGTDTSSHADLIDGIMEFLAVGPRQGYLGEIWFGLGHAASGATQQPPYKEGEPFVVIDAITNDSRGNLYIAGLHWFRGGTPALGVLAYSSVGYKTGPWNLPGTLHPSGVAVDGLGRIYVSQGDRIIRLTR